MGKFKQWCVVGMVVGILFLQNSLSADEKEKEALNSVLAQYQDAVLIVKYVLKMSSSFGAQMGMPEEHKGETVGTVIDPSGLLVISNSELKGPGKIFDMMSVPGMEEKFNMDIVPLDFKVVMPSGIEISAKLVAQDSDLDLAFLRLESKEKLVLKVVPLTKGSIPGTGEILITIGRLSENLNREPMAYNTQVVSVIKKPRIMFLVAGLGNLGCPVFNLDGKSVGIILMRPSAVKRDPMMLMSMSTTPLEFMPMVLPSEEIMAAIGKLPPPSSLEEKKAE